MTSALKIAANRLNAKNSTGPRTRRGKSRSSRNAIRHGLERVNFGITGLSRKVQRLAKEICKDASDPFRYEQAVIIAESQILIARVRAARVAALEHPRTPVSLASARQELRVALAEELRDSVANIRRALPELLTLARYERRALSRRKRAMRRFDALGILQSKTRFDGSEPNARPPDIAAHPLDAGTTASASQGPR